MVTKTRPVKFLCEVADMLAPLAGDPPPQHWLSSDATYSYCYLCARKARWAEMDMIGPPSPPQEWFDRSKIEQDLIDGIEGGEFYSGEADSPQYCETCGGQLRFHLTNAGVEYTIEGFEADTIHPDNLNIPGCVYELRAMLEQGAWSEDDEILADLIKTAMAVKQMMTARPSVQGGA